MKKIRLERKDGTFVEFKMIKGKLHKRDGYLWKKWGDISLSHGNDIYEAVHVYLQIKGLKQV